MARSELAFSATSNAAGRIDWSRGVVDSCHICAL